MLRAMIGAMLARVLVFSAAAVLLAQNKATYEGLPAFVMANDKMELTVIPQGGAFARLVLKGDTMQMNPLWEPLRFARESGQKRGNFGGGTGHFLCVDGFGGVSPEEKAAGLPGHGEAHTLPWELHYSGKEGATATATFVVKLPLTQETLTRTLRLVDGENVVSVQTELASDVAFDRPICWAEHATIGSPFLEPQVTAVDLSGSRARTRPYDRPKTAEHRLPAARDFTWPYSPGVKERKIDLRAAPAKQGTIDHVAVLMDPARKLAWVTAVNPNKKLVFGYIFRREDFPWVQLWENYATAGKMARGLEFSTQPFDVPRREVVSMGTMFEAPLYRWLPAKSKIDSRFAMFYARTPDGFKQVSDVQVQNGKIVLSDKKAGKQVTLVSSVPMQ